MVDSFETIVRDEPVGEVSWLFGMKEGLRDETQILIVVLGILSYLRSITLLHCTIERSRNPYFTIIARHKQPSPPATFKIYRDDPWV